MSDLAGRIAENLAQVRGRIAAAARASGRTSDAITLVAVTKYVDVELATALVAAGCTDLGESRPQELWSKAAALGDNGVSSAAPVRWHLVGHLQRNKIRRTLPLAHLIHSVHGRKLLAALDEDAAGLDQTVGVLLEVNISGDITKTGLAADQLEPIVAEAAALRHVSIRGLMAMASLTGGDAVAQRDFAKLVALRDRVAKNAPPEISLSELSMGMSGDFEIAIEAGATIVRVGSALFEGIAL